MLGFGTSATNNLLIIPPLHDHDISQDVSVHFSMVLMSRTSLKSWKCRNPLLGEVGGWNSHSQSWGLGVLRDSRVFRIRQHRPKHLALGCSWCHWKGRCAKWPRIGHLDICTPSYGQKEGRESNWQFDSRPLKVGNRPLPDIWIGSATWRWKALKESYNFGSDLALIRFSSREIWAPKVPGLQPGQFRETISGLQLGSPGKMCHSDVAPAGSYREYYMGEGGGFPQVRAVVSLVCQSARGLSQHLRVSWMRTNPRVVGSWMQIQAWSSSPSS